MRFNQPFFILYLAGIGTAFDWNQPLRRQATTDVEKAEAIENRYIIEFDASTSFEAAIAEIDANPNTKILKQYNTNIFKGVSVEAISESVETLGSSQRVVKAWQSRLVKLLPSPSGLGNGVDPKNYSVHAMTGVDRLHEQGIFGKGAKVAIVDTGIEFTHDALGGGIGPGYKVEKGYDFIGDTYFPDELPIPDNDPTDTNGHGTHVAGIVAGKGSWFTGVAPDATIFAYKVFGLGPYTDDSIVIEAFLKAYEDGADVISASIGDYSNWSTNPWAVVASRLVDEGIVVTIAAGNDGESGPFRGSTGSSGTNVLAVASVDPSEIVAIPIKATLEEGGEIDEHTLAYRPGPYLFSFDTKAPVYALSLNTSVEDDACAPLPENTPDLSEYIVLVRQSVQCLDSQQVANIIGYNPKGIVFYKHPEVEYLDPWSFYEIPLGVVTDKAGELLIETLGAGGKVTLDFAEVDQYVNMPYPWGAVPSFFTTWGGLFDLTLKPDIAAPGAIITSSYVGNTYATLSGTSMATPYIAGVAALYIGKYGGRSFHGKGFAKMLHSRIMASGASVPWAGNTADGGKHLASPSQIGNGVVNALKVLEYDTQLSFTKFSLNDTRHFSRYQSVEITNNGDKELIYTFGVEAAGGYDALATQGALAPVMNYIQQIRTYVLKPEVRFPAGTFRVKPGETKKAEFTFKLPNLPSGHVEAALPIYSGKINIYGSNGEQLSVPYYGVLSDVKKELREHGVFWRALEWPKIQFHNPGVPLTPWEKPWWDFNTDPLHADWPLLQVANIFGVPEFRWDIFESGWKERNWKWPLVPGQNGYIGSATYWRGSQTMWFDPAVDDKNDVLAFPATDLNRQILHVYIWLGKLANGTQIAPGNYTMRIAGLLPFGNREASDNWEVMKLPPIIEIRAPKKGNLTVKA